MDFIIIKLSFDYCQIKSGAEYEICCDTSIILSGLKPKCCLIKSSSKQKSSKHYILDDQSDFESNSGSANFFEDLYVKTIEKYYFKDEDEEFGGIA